jgi:CRISPR-associated protein Cas2
MYIMITYDISKDKKRYKFAKELLQFGIRTQKSVFECEIDKRELNIIKDIVRRYSLKGDFVTYYEVGKIERKGNTEHLEVDDLVF